MEFDEYAGEIWCWWREAELKLSVAELQLTVAYGGAVACGGPARLGHVIPVKRPVLRTSVSSGILIASSRDAGTVGAAS